MITPGIGSKSLYVTSGHFAHYGKDAFQPIHTPEEDEEYMLKPMNCPHHCEVYARKPRSYKDLPLRIAEFGTVFRYEKSGELHGLTRVRTFTQDDAHIFVRLRRSNSTTTKYRYRYAILKTKRNILVLMRFGTRVKMQFEKPAKKKAYKHMKKLEKLLSTGQN